MTPASRHRLPVGARRLGRARSVRRPPRQGTVSRKIEASIPHGSAMEPRDNHRLVAPRAQEIVAERDLDRRAFPPWTKFCGDRASPQMARDDFRYRQNRRCGIRHRRTRRWSRRHRQSDDDAGDIVTSGEARRRPSSIPTIAADLATADEARASTASARVAARREGASEAVIRVFVGRARSAAEFPIAATRRGRVSWRRSPSRSDMPGARSQLRASCAAFVLAHTDATSSMLLTTPNVGSIPSGGRCAARLARGAHEACKIDRAHGKAARTVLMSRRPSAS